MPLVIALFSSVLGIGLLVLGGAYASRRVPSVVDRVTGAVDRVTDELGTWFSWAEMIASAAAARLGLDNSPTPEAENALKELVSEVLDPFRAWLGRAVTITSGYRSPAVNAAVGGATGSQHMKGEAVDVVFEGGSSSRDLARIFLDGVAALDLEFDQVIWYDQKPHVHVSYTVQRANRNQVLHAVPIPGSTKVSYREELP